MRSCLQSTGRVSCDGPGWLRGGEFHSRRPPSLLGMSRVLEAFDGSLRLPTSNSAYHPYQVGFQSLSPTGRVRPVGGLFAGCPGHRRSQWARQFPTPLLGEAQFLVGSRECHHPPLKHRSRSIGHCQLTHPRGFFSVMHGTVGSMSVSESSGSSVAKEMNLFAVMSCCIILAWA